MKRIAIIGGGIAGVSAAYELAPQQAAGAAMEFVLFEASSRLGGIVETERRDGFVVECGPDSWVTEKPWARELATELGLDGELIGSNDAWRKTYLAEGRKLTPLPDGMRLMVPTNWAAVLNSPLLSWQAKLAYLREPKMAANLKAAALDSRHDESVSDFVLRHFGAEIADTFAAPLLAGVFGGDIATLSARAVLPTLLALEREHGSLILGLQQKLRESKTHVPIFTTLRSGLGTLIERMEARIPVQSLRRNAPVQALERVGHQWRVRTRDAAPTADTLFDAVLVATPSHVTGPLLAPLDARIPELLPQKASSAIVVALAFAPEQAQALRIPRGFGFLVPQRKAQRGQMQHTANDNLEAIAQQALLACTFVDQKFPYRAPEGAVLLRAFFGGPAATQLLQEEDDGLIRLAHTALGSIVGKLPEPRIALVRRWPESLPLYSVGHLDRMAELDARISRLPYLRLIGNSYRGVGLPDLIHAARTAVRELVASLSGA